MFSKRKKFLIEVILSIIVITVNLFASQDTGIESGLVSRMAQVMFQLSIIVFAAWFGQLIFRKIHLPDVLGEIVAGIIIGPYLLGSIAVPGFSEGIFPLLSGEFPVSPELYAFTTIASIILLFLVGLETDIETFFRFSVTGTILGAGGVIVSFLFGNFVGILLSPYLFGEQYGFAHAIPLFLGVISTATSVGISARILSRKRKMDSPEGVTTLSAAVIDDVLGIILLAVVVGVAKSGKIDWKNVSLITAKAITIWLGFTALGIIFSSHISKLLKRIKDRSTISILSFALALSLAVIFEKSGLAMIIGAYVAGLSLSKTDLSYIIQEHLSILQSFFVPIFFCVMGMFIDLRTLTSITILSFGLVYAVFGILGKIIGCSIPALFLNFNLRGALRVGVGMIPRGEVALIMMGIGLSTGIITHEVFNVGIVLVFVTMILTPPLLSKLYDSELSGLRREKAVKKEHQQIVFDMPNPETAELLLNKVIDAFESEAFYVHLIEIKHKLYQIRKEESMISLRYSADKLVFDCTEQDAGFVHTLFYEVLADLEYLMKNLKNLTDKEKIGRKIMEIHKGIKKEKSNIAKILNPLAVSVDLKGTNKEEIIKELVENLVTAGQLPQSKREQVLADLFEREKSMSTGLQNGIAFPHAKTMAVDHIIAAVGIKKEGIDFDSLDKKPSNIFIITLAPKESPKPYLQFMADITNILAKPSTQKKILSCRTNEKLYIVLTTSI
ncbi:cation:proton antiporter [bacterium]